MHFSSGQVAPSCLQDTAATGALGPPGPGPGPGGREGGMGPFQNFMLMRLCFELNASCDWLASCGAISERPCAYLVLHFGDHWISPKWHLAFAKFLRSFVGLI